MATRHTLSVLSALCCLAALAGCAGTPAPQAPQDSTKFTVENTDQFAALDPQAEAAVSCTGLQERMLADGRLEVVANVKNRGSQPVSVQLQCAFLDASGVTTESERPWQSLALAGDATEVVSFTSANQAARRYAIRVKKGR